MNLFEKVTLFSKVKRLSDKCEFDTAANVINTALKKDREKQNKERQHK